MNKLNTLESIEIINYLLDEFNEQQQKFLFRINSLLDNRRNMEKFIGWAKLSLLLSVRSVQLWESYIE